MTQTERVHRLQRLWATLTTQMADDSDLRSSAQFRLLDELIKGLHGRPDVSLVVNNVVRFQKR
jgi:hypothetical protein